MKTKLLKYIFFIVLIFFSCKPKLEGDTELIVNSINSLKKGSLGDKTKCRINVDSLNVIYGYLHPDHFSIYYDTFLELDPQNECEFVVIEYNNGSRRIQKVECSYLSFSRVGFERVTFKKGNWMRFKLQDKRSIIVD